MDKEYKLSYKIRRKSYGSKLIASNAVAQINIIPAPLIKITVSPPAVKII